MAGVKTQKGGPRREPVWAAKPCADCREEIVKLADASRVKEITFVLGVGRRKSYKWVHRKHLFAGGK